MTLPSTGDRPAVNLRLRIALLLVLITALVLWKSQLFLVARPGDHAVPLRAAAAEKREAAHFQALLPLVPVGEMKLEPGGAPLVIEYWAPWLRHAAQQATDLDSLLRLVSASGMPLHAALVCFDPFPSVTRYVARMRLRVPVVLDHERALAQSLPCPSLPYTYVIDRSGRIAVSQAGEVAWLAPETRALLDSIAAAPADSAAIAPVAMGIAHR